MVYLQDCMVGSVQKHALQANWKESCPVWTAPSPNSRKLAPTSLSPQEEIRPDHMAYLP